MLQHDQSTQQKTLGMVYNVTKTSKYKMLETFRKHSAIAKQKGQVFQLHANFSSAEPALPVDYWHFFGIWPKFQLYTAMSSPLVFQ